MVNAFITLLQKVSFLKKLLLVVLCGRLVSLRGFILVGLNMNEASERLHIVPTASKRIFPTPNHLLGTYEKPAATQENSHSNGTACGRCYAICRSHSLVRLKRRPARSLREILTQHERRWE